MILRKGEAVSVNHKAAAVNEAPGPDQQQSKGERPVKHTETEGQIQAGNVAGNGRSELEAGTNTEIVQNGEQNVEKVAGTRNLTKGSRNMVGDGVLKGGMINVRSRKSLCSLHRAEDTELLKRQKGKIFVQPNSNNLELI